MLSITFMGQFEKVAPILYRYVKVVEGRKWNVFWDCLEQYNIEIVGLHIKGIRMLYRASK